MTGFSSERVYCANSYPDHLDPGRAEVTMNLPHHGAALTDLRGRNPQALAGGPTYQFSVRLGRLSPCIFILKLPWKKSNLF